jgi:hypothetical protein
MFNGKNTQINPDPTSIKPIDYRLMDSEKNGIVEPVFAPKTKSGGGPDNWGYYWIDSDDPEGPTFEWIDISSVGVEITGLDDDDSSAAIPIGFDFPFYENIVSELNVGSNGIITFGGGSTARTNTSIPNAAIPNNMIAVWWDDLDPTKGGNIYYYSDVANERFIISFVDVKNYYSTTGTGSLTFQAILYSNGKFQLQFDSMDPGSDAYGLAGSTIGIENSTGDDGLEVVYNAAYMHNNLSILFSAASWMSITPGSGAIDPFDNATINIEFDATDLPAGIYNGQLDISSNDPDTPIMNIPVTLTVESEPSTPEAPILVSPENNGTDLTQPVTFLWNSVMTADSFHIQLSLDSLFSTIENENYLTDTTHSASSLSEGSIHFWRVRAHNDVGWGEWSDTRKFSTEVSWICGDADKNSAVNILDITYLISYLYKEGPAPDPMQAADVDNSGTVNLLDITYLISYLYKGGSEPNCS